MFAWTPPVCMQSERCGLAVNNDAPELDPRPMRDNALLLSDLERLTPCCKARLGASSSSLGTLPESSSSFVVSTDDRACIWSMRDRGPTVFCDCLRESISNFPQSCDGSRAALVATRNRWRVQG